MVWCEENCCGIIYGTILEKFRILFDFFLIFLVYTQYTHRVHTKGVFYKTSKKFKNQIHLLEIIILYLRRYPRTKKRVRTHHAYNYLSFMNPNKGLPASTFYFILFSIHVLFVPQKSIKQTIL